MRPALLVGLLLHALLSTVLALHPGPVAGGVTRTFMPLLEDSRLPSPRQEPPPTTCPSEQGRWVVERLLDTGLVVETRRAVDMARMRGGGGLEALLVSSPLPRQLAGALGLPLDKVRTVLMRSWRAAEAEFVHHGKLQDLQQCPRPEADMDTLVADALRARFSWKCREAEHPGIPRVRRFAKRTDHNEEQQPVVIVQPDHRIDVGLRVAASPVSQEEGRPQWAHVMIELGPVDEEDERPPVPVARPRALAWPVRAARAPSTPAAPPVPVTEIVHDMPSGADDEMVVEGYFLRLGNGVEASRKRRRMDLWCGRGIVAAIVIGVLATCILAMTGVIQ